jgi:hypothetical protein
MQGAIPRTKLPYAIRCAGSTRRRRRVSIAVGIGPRKFNLSMEAAAVLPTTVRLKKWRVVHGDHYVHARTNRSLLAYGGSSSAGSTGASATTK